jgi:hypothetical protein
VVIWAGAVDGAKGSDDEDDDDDHEHCDALEDSHPQHLD